MYTQTYTQLLTPADPIGLKTHQIQVAHHTSNNKSTLNTPQNNLTTHLSLSRIHRLLIIRMGGHHVSHKISTELRTMFSTHYEYIPYTTSSILAIITHAY